MSEWDWDAKLNIRTDGRDDTHADQFHHPYEPTPYIVLERLAESGYITGENVLVDYGCGKGRVGFFLNHATGCRTAGVEYDCTIFKQAEENRKQYKNRAEVEFFCISAERFEVKDADCFYFFNPFTIEILKPIMNRILMSFYDNPRRMRLFFYYPDDEYLGYLLTGEVEELLFLDEIDCRDLFVGEESRERIMIFEIGG